MQEKKRFITAFDITVCAIAALFVIGAAYFILRARTQERISAPLSYTVRIVGVPTNLIDTSSLITAGDSVFSENGTLPLGSVEKVETQPHRKAVVQNGVIVLREVPDLIDIDVTVDAIGFYGTGYGWRVSDVRIAAGAQGTFRIGRYYAANATILAITLQKGATDNENG